MFIVLSAPPSLEHLPLIVGNLPLRRDRPWTSNTSLPCLAQDAEVLGPGHRLGRTHTIACTHEQAIAWTCSMDPHGDGRPLREPAARAWQRHHKGGGHSAADGSLQHLSSTQNRPVQSRLGRPGGIPYAPPILVSASVRMFSVVKGRGQGHMDTVRRKCHKRSSIPQSLWRPRSVFSYHRL